MTLGDRVVVMRDGRIEQEGRPEELFANPLNAFVAAYTGGINTFAASFDAADRSVLVRLTGMDFVTELETGEGFTPSTHTRVMVRPGDIELLSSRHRDCIEVEITDRQYYGHYWEYTCRRESVFLSVYSRLNIPLESTAWVRLGKLMVLADDKNDHHNGE